MLWRCAVLIACLPHARGGVSEMRARIICFERSSPRPWGCFLNFRRCQSKLLVFPTPVGVFQNLYSGRSIFLSLPHARGGVSAYKGSICAYRRSSPRPWGCFQASRDGEITRIVFPTPVGVFPENIHATLHRSCLPHARGGVSKE